jgi:hypothetical protein
VSTHPARLDHLGLARSLLGRKPVLVDKLVRACGIAAEEAPVLLCEVLRFVSLAAHASAALERSLTPSVTVDDAWHELILCTREYHRLCLEHFNRFVHHDPGGDEAQNRAQFRDTLRLYALYFGRPDPRWWGPQAEGMPDASCGACESSSTNLSGTPCTSTPPSPSTPHS